MLCPTSYVCKICEAAGQTLYLCSKRLQPVMILDEVAILYHEA
jgi:hypothetical protein